MQIRLEDGMTIDEAAIKLIQAYEPPEGYYLGFSGGKDSIVINDLAERSGVKFTPVYNVSPIDSRLIHHFIKLNYPQVVWENHAQGFWNKHFMTYGLPTRRQRWCCKIIKEAGGNDRIKILGMRTAESSNRSHYQCFSEQHNSKNTFQLLPILNWSDADVWQYVAEHHLITSSLYNHGFNRIGCVLCPFSNKADIKISMQLFPEIILSWKNAANRYVIERNTNPKRKPLPFKTGEEYFNWWIQR